MRLFFWTLAHCLTLGLLGLATEVVVRNNVPLRNWDLFAIPVLIGFIQTLFLVHRLRFLAILWIPATLFGIQISFLGIWWFGLFIGAGIGIAQTSILLTAKFKRWWLWAPANAVGWVAGLSLGNWLAIQVDPLVTRGEWRMPFVMTIGGLVYGLLTGLSLLAMSRTEQPVATEEKSPA